MGKDKIKELIKRNVAERKRANSKEKELQRLRQEYDDLSNTNLFDMTFEKYHRKDSLNNYLNNQTMQLSSYLARGDGETGGNIGQQLAFIIRNTLNTDDEVKEAYEEFKGNRKLEEAYNELFNNKLKALHGYTLKELESYSKVADDGASVENSLKMYLPKPKQA